MDDVSHQRLLKVCSGLSPSHSDLETYATIHVCLLLFLCCRKFRLERSYTNRYRLNRRSLLIIASSESGRDVAYLRRTSGFATKRIRCPLTNLITSSWTMRSQYRCASLVMEAICGVTTTLSSSRRGSSRCNGSWA